MTKSKKLLTQTSNLVKHLASHVREARLARGDTQEVLAARAGLGVATLRRLEGGEAGTSIGHYCAVLEALGLGHQWVDSVSPTNNPFHVPSGTRQRAGHKTGNQLEWGEDLFK